MKQVFKGKKLTAQKCINSIIRFYEESTLTEWKDGMEWYNTAHNYAKELSGRYNLTVQQIAGLIAVFSPQAGWLENKRYTVSFLINPNKPVRSAVQCDKAKHILSLTNESDIYHALALNGKAFKTKAFFLNIQNPDIATAVTIDRHAIAIAIQEPSNVYALDSKYGQLTEAQYKFFASCYQKAAKKLNILPHQLQAITWVTYRRLRDLKAHSEELELVPFF